MLRKGTGVSASIATKLLEVDAIVREVMGKIHAGNRGPQAKQLALAAFLRKYGHFFQFADAMPLVPISSDDILGAIKAMPDNTPGLDSISKDDLACIGPEAAAWLAKMFMAIEEGAPWPSATVLIRTAFPFQAGG
jgi:hypothetical protein